MPPRSAKAGALPVEALSSWTAHSARLPWSLTERHIHLTAVTGEQYKQPLPVVARTFMTTASISVIAKAIKMIKHSRITKAVLSAAIPPLASLSQPSAHTAWMIAGVAALTEINRHHSNRVQSMRLAGHVGNHSKLGASWAAAAAPSMLGLPSTLHVFLLIVCAVMTLVVLEWMLAGREGSAKRGGKPSE